MENATLTTSRPQAMKNFIVERLDEANFSSPSEYIGFLIRLDQKRRSRDAVVRTRKHKGRNRTKASPSKD